MCGINGFNFKNSELINQMNEQTKHRGPDAGGVYFDGQISLGHNRLSIIDLSAAAGQPMLSADGSLAIVFNGEIYNFQDLKNELSAGYDFKTHSDTEVILAAYQKWGNDCAQKLNGIFAFAVWDKNRQTLFLARDHLGVKPLYYYHDGRQFIFSSELKGILVHSFPKQLNLEALNIYFRLLYVPEPLTPWKNIYKLPPAHYLILKNNEPSIKRYWQLDRFDFSGGENDLKKNIKDKFCQAVTRQLISDRPLGLYLSGGIDSTALLGVMAEKLRQPVKTFTVGFQVDAGQYEKFNADFELAKKTSRYFKSDHAEIMLTPSDIKDNFEKIIWHADDLAANHTQPAMYALSALAKQKVAVVLAGDGGDELFAGYSRYYFDYLIDKFQSVPEWARRNAITQSLFLAADKRELYQKLNAAPGVDRWLLFMAQKESMVGNFLRPEFNQPAATRDFLLKKFLTKKMPADSTKKMQYIDINTWLVDDALNRADRMSMAHGLEERVPFLDKDLAELAISIPPRYLIGGKDSGKKIFKEALNGYLPDFIYREPKRGFFSPVAKWLRGDLKNWAQEILSADYNKDTQDFFDFQAVQSIFDKHLTGETYALNAIWPLLTFQVWYRIFKDSR